MAVRSGGMAAAGERRFSVIRLGIIRKRFLIVSCGDVFPLDFFDF